MKVIVYLIVGLICSLMLHAAIAEAFQFGTVLGVTAVIAGLCYVMFEIPEDVA